VVGDEEFNLIFPSPDRTQSLKTYDLKNFSHHTPSAELECTCCAFFRLGTDEFEVRIRRSDAEIFGHDIGGLFIISRVPHAYILAIMTTHSSPPPDEQLVQRVRSKREQVLVACKVCRGRKTKVRCVEEQTPAIAHHRCIVTLASMLTSASV
jgi:hypothetical protein